MSNLTLPDLVLLDDYGGNFANFENAVYSIFSRDFIHSKPAYNGRSISLKIYPLQNNKECTYYHITHEGKDEENRTPDLRRMERIGFPRPIIENSNHSDLKVWKNTRGKRTRILILHETEQFLVVLEERENYILFWTSYCVSYSSNMRKLIKEYEEYIKTATA